MSRYQIVGEWAPLEHTVFHYVYSDLIAGKVTRESATLKDTRGGYEYPEGAYRVRIECKQKAGFGFKTKTFKGESAWNASERYFEDAYRALDRLAMEDVSA